MEMQSIIDDIQKRIFAYDTGNIMEQITNAMTFIVENNLISMDDNNILQTFNTIMQESIQAIINKDYLLLADLLEYRLKPLLNNDSWRIS